MSANDESDLQQQAIRDLFAASEQMGRAIQSMISQTTDEDVRSLLERHAASIRDQLEALRGLLDQDGSASGASATPGDRPSAAGGSGLNQAA